MIGLDTNVLLRVFLEDDPEQCERARKLVDSITSRDRCSVNAVVLSEFAWTLAKSWKKPRGEVVRYLEGVLQSDGLQVEHLSAATAALASYRRGKADFADYFLAEIYAELGCATTATFDGDALDSKSFSPVP